jgi:hypothetical protein
MTISRKAFRVLVTERCNMRCPTCFNKDIRNGREMPTDDFVLLCRLLAEQGHIKRIKMMGGEPTVHCKFPHMLAAAMDHFPHVYLFTNAVNEVVETLRLRGGDAVIYNLSCLSPSVPSRKLLPELECGHLFETRIDARTDVDRVCRKLRHVHDCLGQRMVVNLTLNCVEDIFASRHVIVRNWNAVGRFCRDELGITLNLDHDAPHCFVRETNMLLDRYHPLCSPECMGLVTADLQLRFCNQTSEDLLSLRDGQGLVPYAELDACLERQFSLRMESNRDHFCRGCPDFPATCNGSCFAHRFPKGAGHAAGV